MAYQPNNLSLRQAVALVCELTGMTTAEAEADIAAAGRDGAFQARAHEAAEIHDGLQWPLPIIDGVSYVPARFWGFTIRWQANELVRGREGATGVTIRRAAIERIWRPAAKEKEKADTAPRKRGPRPALGQRIERRMLEDLATGKVTREALADRTEEALKAEYGASRDTCRKARRAALSKFVGVSVPAHADR